MISRSRNRAQTRIAQGDYVTNSNSSSELLRWLPTSVRRTGQGWAPKARAWEELHRAGVLVPPGFVITAQAFQRFMDDLEREHPIRARITALDPDNTTAIAAACRGIRKLIERTPLPEDLLKSISNAYQTLRNRLGSASLRSTRRRPLEHHERCECGTQPHRAAGHPTSGFAASKVSSMRFARAGRASTATSPCSID